MYPRPARNEHRSTGQKQAGQWFSNALVFLTLSMGSHEGTDSLALVYKVFQCLRLTPVSREASGVKFSNTPTVLYKLTALLHVL